MAHSKESIQIQVGAFTAIGLLLFMTILFMLGNEKKFFEKQYTLISHFDDISGLRVGAPVQLAGINVGVVSQVEFESALERKKVKLTLKVTYDYQERIRSDSVASIVTQGLLGDKMVFITVGSPDQPVIKDKEELTSQAPQGFAEVLENSNELIENVTEVSKQINNILKEVQSGKGMLHALIYDPEGGKLVADMRSLGTRLNETSASMANITGKIDAGHGTLGALVNDPTLFNDLKTLIGKANRNKLIRAVIRETLRTKEEEGLKK